MSKFKQNLGFWIVLIEWYEFTIYNSLIPYGIFGGKTETSIYYGFIIFALSFMARPIGSIYFSQITDRTKSIRLTLLVISISTILMGFYPDSLQIPSIWFGLCKIMQGFALGGSYGLSYLDTYSHEEAKSKPKLNYKLAKVQTGWVYGMLIGEGTIFILKVTMGNLGTVVKLIQTNKYLEIFHLPISSQFISWGWRVPFIFTSIIGLLLYFKSRNLQEVKTERRDIIRDMGQFIFKQPILYYAIFMVVSIDMILFHSWFTYQEVVSDTGVMSTVFANIRRILLLILFPIMGKLTDSLPFGYRNNYIILALTCISMIVFSLIPLPTYLWIAISSVTAAMCYGSIVVWAIRIFGYKAGSLLGPTFNLSSGLVGSVIPLVSTLASANGLPANCVTIALSIVSLLSLGYAFSRGVERQR